LSTAALAAAQAERDEILSNQPKDTKPKGYNVVEPLNESDDSEDDELVTLIGLPMQDNLIVAKAFDDNNIKEGKLVRVDFLKYIASLLSAKDLFLRYFNLVPSGSTSRLPVGFQVSANNGLLRDTDYNSDDDTSEFIRSMRLKNFHDEQIVTKSFDDNRLGPAKPIRDDFIHYIASLLTPKSRHIFLKFFNEARSPTRKRGKKRFARKNSETDSEDGYDAPTTADQHVFMKRREAAVLKATRSNRYVDLTRSPRGTMSDPHEVD
jgi:hypothetical protein